MPKQLKDNMVSLFDSGIDKRKDLSGPQLNGQHGLSLEEDKGGKWLLTLVLPFQKEMFFKVKSGLGDLDYFYASTAGINRPKRFHRPRLFTVVTLDKPTRAIWKNALLDVSCMPL